VVEGIGDVPRGLHVPSRGVELQVRLGPSGTREAGSRRPRLFRVWRRPGVRPTSSGR
jgi:hypothetical protein